MQFFLICYLFFFFALSRFFDPLVLDHRYISDQMHRKLKGENLNNLFTILEHINRQFGHEKVAQDLLTMEQKLRQHRDVSIEC